MTHPIKPTNNVGLATESRLGRSRTPLSTEKRQVGKYSLHQKGFNLSFLLRLTTRVRSAGIIIYFDAYINYWYIYVCKHLGICYQFFLSPQRQLHWAFCSWIRLDSSWYTRCFVTVLSNKFNSLQVCWSNDPSLNKDSFIYIQSSKSLWYSVRKHLIEIIILHILNCVQSIHKIQPMIQNCYANFNIIRETSFKRERLWNEKMKLGSSRFFN